MQIKITRLTLLAFLLILVFQSQAQNVWRHRACLPGPGRNTASFAIGNIEYVIGGPGYVQEIWQYDPVTDAWTQKNNFPSEIVGLSVFVINNTAYAGCGFDSLGNYYTNFWKYNSTADIWTSIAPFIGAPRYTAMSFALNGMGYVGCGKGGNEYSDFYQYNPTADIWTQKANFPGSNRQNGLGLSAGSFGYMGFGYDGNNGLSDCYRYNPVSDSWMQIDNLNTLGRFGPGCFVINDTIYVAGGGSLPDINGIATFFFSDCWRYDITANTWITEDGFECISLARMAYGGVALNGRGYIPCGNDANEHFHDLLEFGPVDTAFTERVHVLGSDSSYCSGLSRQLTVSDSCAVWSTGEEGSTITVNSAGTYWVRINDSCGVESDTLVIKESNLSIADSIQNATCGADNGSAGIIVLGGVSPYTFTWSNGDTTANILNVAEGIYAVTVSDLSNCSATISVLINSAGKDTVSVKAAQTQICSGDSALVCATTGFDNYIWNTDQTGSCIYTSLAGNYYVTATGPGNCSAESNHILITVLSSPSVSITVNDDTLTCYHGIGYQWYYNNDSIPGATTSVYVANEPGIYSVMIVDSDGCAAETNGVKIPVTGITNIELDENISIYPNPLNQGNWTLEVPTSLLGSKAEIYDVNGRLVYSDAIKNTRWTIDFNAASGLYTICILCPDKCIVQKLVKL